jgi:hypothetical protein
MTWWLLGTGVVLVLSWGFALALCRVSQRADALEAALATMHADWTVDKVSTTAAPLREGEASRAMRGPRCRRQ